MTMNYIELMKQPDGVIFYENDMPTMPMLIKIKTVKDDILIKALSPVDADEYCFGFSEMDKAEKNSMDFIVLDNNERNRIAEILRPSTPLWSIGRIFDRFTKG